MTTFKHIAAIAILLGICVMILIGFGFAVVEQYQKHGAFGAVFFVSAIFVTGFLVDRALDWAGRTLK